VGLALLMVYSEAVWLLLGCLFLQHITHIFCPCFLLFLLLSSSSSSMDYIIRCKCTSIHFYFVRNIIHIGMACKSGYLPDKALIPAGGMTRWEATVCVCLHMRWELTAKPHFKAAGNTPWGVTS
jgi:hypothetical protein